MPLICLGAFLFYNNDAFGATVALWWFAESLMDLAPYINDARDLQLILLGGVTGQEVEGHDWEYLLANLGWSQYDHTLATRPTRSASTSWCSPSSGLPPAVPPIPQPRQNLRARASRLFSPFDGFCHRSLQRVRLDRLHQIVHRSELERREHGFDIILCGHDNHRDRRGMRSEIGNCLPPAHLRIMRSQRMTSNLGGSSLA